MTLTPTAALVEEAEALNDLIQPGPFTKCGEDGDYWVENRHGQKLEEFRDRDMATFFARARTLVPKFATALRRAEAERDESRRDAEAYKRQTQEVSAKAIELTKEVSAKLDQAEAERDAQHALVLRLTAESEEARLRLKTSEEGLRVVTMERDHAQQVEAPDAFLQRDEARAQVWGLICAGSNMAERRRYFQGLWETALEAGLKLERRVSELTVTRDLLTAENARLQAQVATLELLRRGGK